RGRHTRSKRDWSSDVCSSDLAPLPHFPAITSAAISATDFLSVVDVDDPPALPPLTEAYFGLAYPRIFPAPTVSVRRATACPLLRSEERRVGEEVRTGWYSVDV